MAYELFIDGFDHYATADITKKWPLGDAYSISTGNGRRGTNGMYLGGTVGRQVTASTHGVIGAAIKTGASSRGYFAVFLNGTTHLRMAITADYRITITRTGIAFGEDVLLATSTNALTPAVWNYIEFGFHIDNAGSIELRVNGSSVGWIPHLDIDTQLSGLGAGFNALWLGWSAADVYVDDCYMTYGEEIKFLGDSRVDTLALTANASPQDWTPDTGNAWERLNQDAGYISSDTINATSLFAAGNLSHNPSTIHGVQINGHAYKTDAGSREAAMVLKSGTTTDVGTSLALSTDTLLIREPHIVNPDTGVAFTKAGVDGLEVGVKVTA